MKYLFFNKSGLVYETNSIYLIPFFFTNCIWAEDRECKFQAKKRYGF